MMDCHTTRESLHAWIDGELDPREADALELHLAGCGECQSQAAAARAQAAELQRAFAPGRAAAERLAEETIAKWAAETPVPATAVPATATPSQPWISLLLAMALGFFLAVLVFQPWKSHEPPTAKVPDAAPLAPGATTAPPIARVVLATGQVEVHEPGISPWQCAPPGNELQIFTCPSDSTVKTGPNVRCEVETASGCVIRLNQETEVKLTSASSLEIRRGQIWCRSPKDIAFRVVTAPVSVASPPNVAPPGSPGAWSAACPSNGCMTAALEDGRVRVTSSEGEVEVQTAGGRARLARGETAAIADGRIVKSPATDPLLAVSWIQPLLVRKGHGQREIEERVEQLLARVNASDIDAAYGQEIRGLGEFAVPSLVRFLRASDPPQTPAVRESTMRILADIAPGWAAGDLIELLADENAEIRVLAATSLVRLTNLDQGRRPEQWRELLDACRPNIALWQKWWATHRDQYPAPARDGGKTRKISL